MKWTKNCLKTRGDLSFRLLPFYSYKRSNLRSEKIRTITYYFQSYDQKWQNNYIHRISRGFKRTQGSLSKFGSSSSKSLENVTIKS